MLMHLGAFGSGVGDGSAPADTGNTMASTNVLNSKQNPLIGGSYDLTIKTTSL